jgi:hypothetical protein
MLESIFGFSKETRMMMWAIQELGKQESIIGTAYKEITYNAAKTYAERKSNKIIVNGTDYKGDYIEFLTNISHVDYIVSLTESPDGRGSILTVRKA